VTRPVRALIVDDEAPARELLRAMLGRLHDILVVGEAEDGEDAVAAIRSLAPHLVFLDVQMPALDAFGVIAAIGTDRMPAVVFVTAYDRYALKAFDVHAVDFLLKPYDQQRLETAVSRTLDRLRRPTEISAQLEALLADVGKHKSYPERIPVRTDGRIRLLDVEQIDWIEARDKFLRLHISGSTLDTRATMNGIERELDPALFVRIHRSTIVNIRRVREIQPWFQSDYVVVLRDGTKLRTGRAYRDSLRRLIEGQ
jgi:two-component system LytT family response regulator